MNVWILLPWCLVLGFVAWSFTEAGQAYNESIEDEKDAKAARGEWPSQAQAYLEHESGNMEVCRFEGGKLEETWDDTLSDDWCRVNCDYGEVVRWRLLEGAMVEIEFEHYDGTTVTYIEEPGHPISLTGPVETIRFRLLEGDPVKITLWKYRIFDPEFADEPPDVQEVRRRNRGGLAIEAHIWTRQEDVVIPTDEFVSVSVPNCEALHYFPQGDVLFKVDRDDELYRAGRGYIPHIPKVYINTLHYRSVDDGGPVVLERYYLP